MPADRAYAIGPRDLLLAVTVLVLDLTMFSYVGAASGPARAEVVVPYAALACAALLWRRRAPVLVFGVTWVHAMVAVLIPEMAYLPTIPMLAAMYTVTLDRGTRAGWLTLPLYLVPAAFAVADAVSRASIEEAWRNALIVAVMELSLGVAAVAFGRAALTIRRLGRVEAEAALSAERMRIARELHDIVAHSVTVIVLQAAGAQKLLRTRPEESGRALSQIGEVGKQAMDELRRLLRVLRAPDRATDGPEQSPAAPQPGLAQATALVASIRAAGTPVTLRHSGEPVSLEPGVDLAAYRIVQEALTNVTKHTPRGTAATVDVAWTGQALSLRIANPAPASGRPAAAGLTCGYGLLGIRERAALAGGDLSAGHTADGGFEVCATLPTTTPAGAPPLAVQPGTGKEKP